MKYNVIIATAFFCLEAEAGLSEAEDCYRLDISYNQGQAIAQKRLQDHRECQAWCRLVRRCTHFSFNTRSSLCFLRQGDRSTHQPGVISGPKTCPEPSNLSDTRPVCDKSGQLCLEGGQSRVSGHVMLAGRPVCDDEWDLEDAAVVCRQLGFPGVKRVTRDSEFGTVSSSFAMDDVRCAGNETSLGDCRHKAGDDCDGHEAAGVVCSEAGVSLEPGCLEEAAICLNGGQDKLSGNVYFEGHPVCHNGWDFSDANVICKSIGFSGAANFTTGGVFGAATSYFSLTGVQCRGTEADIRECPHEAGGQGCDTASVAGVICLPEGADEASSANTRLYITLGVGLTAAAILITLSVLIASRESGKKYLGSVPAFQYHNRVSFVNPIMKVSDVNRIVNKSEYLNMIL